MKLIMSRAAKIICSLLSCMVALPAGANECSLTPIRTLRFDDAQIRIVNFALTEGGITYTSALKRSVSLEETHELWARRIPGRKVRSKALRYSIGPCGGAPACAPKIMQKIQHHFLYSGPPMLPVLEPGFRYTLRFGFRVQTFEAPWAIIGQLWQGSPHSPPFALTVVKDGEALLLKAMVRNDRTGSNPSAAPDVIGASPPLHLGTWYDAELSFEPPRSRSDSSPSLILKVRTALTDWRFDVESHDVLGYTGMGACPYARNCLIRAPNPTLDFQFGLYRPASAGSTVVDFDEVMLFAARPERCLLNGDGPERR